MDIYCERCDDTGWARASRGVERCVCWAGNPVLASRRRQHAAWLARRERWRRSRRRVVSNQTRPPSPASDPRAVQIGVAAARLAAIALELREEGWRATFSADAQAGTVSVTVALDPRQGPEPR